MSENKRIEDKRVLKLCGSPPMRAVSTKPDILSRMKFSFATNSWPFSTGSSEQ
jgi:hypothetical protein